MANPATPIKMSKAEVDAVMSVIAKSFEKKAPSDRERERVRRSRRRAQERASRGGSL